MRRTLPTGLVALTLLLTACTPAVVVTEPSISATDTEVCAPMLAALPDEVLGSVPRETTTDLARAWGDPPITVVCGGPAPEALTPASQCLEVSGVGWWEQAGDRGSVWTTIGRTSFVTVGIPAEYGDPVTALAQLSPPIAQHNPVVTPCVG